LKGKTTIPLTKATIRESAIKELTWRGHNVWINNNLAVRGRKFIGRLGVADIIGISGIGSFVACEVKTHNDRLSTDQIKFLNDVKTAGGIALIAHQVGNRVELKEWEIQNT
jgi:hypothetical protein